MAAPVAERFEAVIGIEVHCRPRTASKMFCGCSANFDEAPPNSHVCPVCFGLPGALPVINRLAVEHVIATGLAIEASIPPATRWDRKNYFYPDLPKGYQISQYDLPLASDGRLTFDTAAGPFTVRIRRAHLEEDTARLQHTTADDGRRVSLVDFNRSGAPLMEIVTEPDIRTAEQARRYAEELQMLLRAIGVSDADMERGQMRVEANVSLRRWGSEAFGTRVEIKNMNSFRSVERAIASEIERQAASIDAGEAIVQETRGWDEARGTTYVMRVKESSDDYRYFPEPDLPPLHLEPAWLDAIRARQPELPAARRTRYGTDLGLSPYDAALIVAEQLAASVAGEYLRLLRKFGEGEVPHVEVGDAGRELAAVIMLVLADQITRTNAKEVFETWFVSRRPVAEIVAERGLTKISDEGAIGRTVDEVMAANPQAVADYRAGKAQAVGFLVGQVMKATRGQANASAVQAAVRERLDGAGEE
jgi:aspartyl-tRNA(Asn)/glutamyl-tRNA(Gln) amidotransferase subunit B